MWKSDIINKRGGRHKQNKEITKERCTMNINWDAKGYKENFSFVHEYGEDVVSLLKSPKGAAVLDLGFIKWKEGETTVAAPANGSFEVTGSNYQDFIDGDFLSMDRFNFVQDKEAAEKCQDYVGVYYPFGWRIWIA